MDVPPPPPPPPPAATAAFSKALSQGLPPAPLAEQPAYPLVGSAPLAQSMPLAYTQPLAASPALPNLEEQRLLVQLREEMDLNAKQMQAQHARDIARLEADLREQAQSNERVEARAKKAEEMLRDIEARARKTADDIRVVEDRIENKQDSLRSEVREVKQNMFSEMSVLREESSKLLRDQGSLKRELSETAENLNNQLQTCKAELRSTSDKALRALQVAEDCHTECSSLEGVAGRVLALETKVHQVDRIVLQGKSIGEQIMYFRAKEQRESPNKLLQLRR